MELVLLEHVNNVQGSKAWIEELINLVRLNSEQQGLPIGYRIEGVHGNSGSQGHAPSTSLEAIKVDYTRAIRRNWMLEDDYTCMVSTTFIYVMCEKVLMDELEKLQRPCNQWIDH